MCRLRVGRQFPVHESAVAALQAERPFVESASDDP
jgi:hypothetical protein